MSQLDSFTPEDRELLISLFYRVGVFVSYAEDEDGEQDDELEMKALERILLAIAKYEKKSEFAMNMAREAIRHKDDWERWNNQTFQVVDDCRKAALMLYNVVPETDFNRYRYCLIKIAETVASAYGEFGVDDFEDENEGFFSRVVDKLSTGLKSSKEDDGFMNITSAEDQAIIDLKNALKKPDEK